MKIRSGSVFFAIRKLSFKRRAKFIIIKGIITIDISDLTFVERYVTFFVISVEENVMDTDHEERVTEERNYFVVKHVSFEIKWKFCGIGSELNGL